MGHHTPDEIAALVFIDIAVIVVVARLMGMLFRRLRQPAVIGEMLAGIALGPSLLGQLPGNLPEVVFPLEVRPYLRVVAQIGLVIFMFIVGLELNVGLIRGKERAAATISLSSVVLPFGLGVGLALWLHQEHRVVGGEQTRLLPFALFIGASMSITAFPVLARILSERGMHRTQIGALTLACAAVDDILAWSILAVVLAVAASSGAWGLPLILVESIAFVAFMFLVVKPQLRRLVTSFAREGRLTPNVLAVVLVGFLASAYVTDRIGIHSIFGAFLFGVVMPREESEALFHEILEKLEQVSVLLLLPVFFIATGLNVDVGGLGGHGMVELAAVLAVAIAGKFVGASVAARALGLRARKAAAIGVLMNTRGLTELVILNIGLGVGVLDQELFTIFVLMAIVTTVMTEPLLRLVYPDRMLARDIAEAERAALGLVDAYRIVVAVDDPADGEPAVDAGVALLGTEQPAELLLSKFDRPVKVEVGTGLSAELASVTAGFEGMQSLVRRAGAAGVRAVVRTQFSDDAVRDLLAQTEAVDADALLLPAVTPEDVARAERLARLADCAVLLAAGRPSDGTRPGRVVAFPGSGGDGLAAVEQAARVALRAGVPVEVADTGERKDHRRAAGLVERLTAAGIDARVLAATAFAFEPGSVVLAGLDGRPLPEAVAAAGSFGDATVVLVRSARDDRGERLQRLLEERGDKEPVVEGR